MRRLSDRGRFLVLCFGLLASVRSAGAEESLPSDRAFVEVLATPSNPYVGEPFDLRLRFGFDAGYFASHAVPLFRHPTDVPVEVIAPWAFELADAVRLPDAPRAAAAAPKRLTFSLNGRAAQGEPLAPVTRNGRTYTVVEVVHRYRIDAPGQREIVAPTLRFVRATLFDDDFLRGRVATDPADVTLRGAPTSLQVASLPLDGRPPGFAGAVGRFSLEAAVDRTTIVAGDTLRLTLRLAGEGDLQNVEPPRLGSLAGFHVYGVLDDRGAGSRVLVYELAPLTVDVTEVPPIAFAFFERGPPDAYRVIHTAKVPLHVTPSPRRSRAGQGPHDEGAPTRPSGGLRVPPWALAALAIAVIGLAARASSRRRAVRIAGAAADPARARARGALAAYRARSTRPGVDPADSFAEYLSAHLLCSPAAVIAPDLARRLGASGVPAELAVRTASALEARVSARYRGGGGVPGTEDLAALTNELEAVFVGRAEGSGIQRSS